MGSSKSNGNGKIFAGNIFPLPGGYDVRFATNRYAGFFSSGNQKEIRLSIHSNGALVTLSWTIKEKEGREYLLVEKKGSQIIAQHRLTANGVITLTDVEKKIFILKSAALPVAYLLAQNIPNPFNPTTRLQYALPVDSKVRLVVYNLLGQVVAELVNGAQTAGYKQVEWNASDFSSGVYFYRLEATSTSDVSKRFTSVKKMLLIK